MTNGKRPIVPPRLDIVVAEHRAKIARWLLEGRSADAMAADLGISRETVYRDINAIEAAFMERSMEDFKTARMRAYGQLEVIKQEYIQQYNLSKQPSKRTTTRQVETVVPNLPPATGVLAQAQAVAAATQGTPSTTTLATRLEVGEVTEERLGNPVYLAGAMAALDRQIKLLGLDAVDKANIDLAAMTKVYLVSSDGSNVMDEV